MTRKKIRGFTLLELLLVLAIASTMIVLLLGYTTQKADEMRRDKALLQVQQILNAGLAFYIQNGKWPASGLLNGSNELQSQNYLPSGSFKNPWGKEYEISNDGKTFKVISTLSTDVANRVLALQAQGRAITGQLPLAVWAENATGGTVSAFVNIPGQNLNNARSLNFAGVYHNGACVPRPECPTGMVAQIVVLPGQVSGVYDRPMDCTPDSNGNFTCSQKLFSPLTSFSAYAVGPPSNTPLGCDGSAATSCYKSIWPQVENFSASDGVFWRVCLSVYTSQGKIDVQGAGSWGQTYGTVIAFTRCATTPESTQKSVEGGSATNVWAP